MKISLLFWMSSLFLFQPLYAQHLGCSHLLGPQSPFYPQGLDYIWWTIDTDSLVVIEAENLFSLPGFWSAENEVGGATESGYLEWKNGDPSTGIDNPGTDTLSYFFHMPQGTYRLIFHSAAPDNTEHNDIWVRFPNHTAEARRPDGSNTINLGSDWFKVYQNEGGNRWTFDTFTVDNDPHEVYYISSEDPFWRVVQLSGRSTQFKLNRIVLVHDDLPPGTGKDLSIPESICSTLPVELTSFEGLLKASEVFLKWTTASEQNNSGFYIEYATDSAFQKAGYVPGAGTTTEIQHYTFSHSPDNAAGKEVRYRLKQIDFDGTFEYSDTITLQMPLANTMLLHKAYPNPFNPATTLSFSLPTQSDVHLNVYDMSGRLVQQLLNETRTAGYHRVSFTAATNLPSGTYIYRLTTANFADSGIITFLK